MSNIKPLYFRLAGLIGAFGFVFSSAAQAESLTVRLDFIPVGFHAAMHLAKEKGWFAREGLEVDIQDGTGSLNTIQLVGAGQVDVGQVQLGVMAISREKGVPVKSFAGFVRKSDLGVIVPRDSGMKTVKDLKGKKLLCFSASPWAPFIDNFLAKGGLDRSSVEISMVPPATMAAVYMSNGADGIMTVEPFGLPIVEKARPSTSIRLADYGINFPSYGLIATETTLTQKKDALAKLAKVQVETWEYIWNGHVDEAVDALIKARSNIKLDHDIVKGQLEFNRSLLDTENTKGKRIGWQSDKDWELALRDIKASGAIASYTKPEDYFTNALLPQ
jgi:NitT/TauT family transport system substrate-binding protein